MNKLGDKYFEETALEIIDSNNKKKIYFFQKKLSGQGKVFKNSSTRHYGDLYSIMEDDLESYDSEKFKNFKRNDYFEKLISGNKV